MGIVCTVKIANSNTCKRKLKYAVNSVKDGATKVRCVSFCMKVNREEQVLRQAIKYVINFEPVRAVVDPSAIFHIWICGSPN